MIKVDKMEKEFKVPKKIYKKVTEVIRLDKNAFKEKEFKTLDVLEKKRRESISKTLIGKKLRSNEKHPRWKGDKASKISLHIWIAKNKPKPEVCEFCKKKRKLNLANMKNHDYTRNIDDYKWLCYSCHKKMDLGNRKNTIIVKKWIKPHLMKNNPRYKGGKYSKVKGHYRTWRVNLKRN